MIDIKNIDGRVLYSAPVMKNAVFRHELMSEEYVQLQFDEVSLLDFPVGCYIEHNGGRYSVIDPVIPELISGGYRYSIHFCAEWMRWKSVTYFFINEFTGKTELSWSMTGTPDLFLKQIVDNISRATGKTYTFSFDSSLTATKDLQFDNTTVLAALSMIAEAFETEWWIEGTIIHLSRCEYGETISLSYGDNIGVPTASGEREYANRIYAYGSTRNITQDYQSGGTTNALVQKRLTLPVDKYPGGYKDIRHGLLPEEIIEKTVIFDDIYPSSDFPISNVRVDPKIDLETIIGKDEKGNPIYATFPIYYFKIAGIEFTKDLIIEGLTLKVHFLSGQLQGREFALAYHEDTKEYEIITDQETGSIKIPNETLLPGNGDVVVLFNIQMPPEYVTSAEIRLEKALDEFVDNTFLTDNTTYSFSSNPVAFAERNISVTVGRKVMLNYGLGTLDSRVLSVEFPLDTPSKVEISVGESTPKGKIASVETEMANVSSTVEVIQAYNDVRQTIQNVYGKAIRDVNQTLFSLGNMWWLDKGKDESDQSKWVVRSRFNVATDRTISQFGPATGSGSGGGGGTAYHDQLLNLDYPNQHPIAAVTGLQQALDAKLNASAISAWALEPEKPTYSVGEISGLQTTLDGYLPLTGGDLTGNLTINHNQVWYAGNSNRRESDWSAAYLTVYGGLGYGDVGKTEFGRDSNGAYFNSMNTAGATTAQLRLWNNGRITCWSQSAGNVFFDIWHSGNDGAGSGLDADLLDGYHIDTLCGNFQSVVDASGLSEDYYYPVTIYVSPGERLRISVIVALNSGTVPSWSTHGAGFSCRFIEEVSGNGWGTIFIDRVVLDNTYLFATKSPIGLVGQLGNGSAEVIHVRGGGRYYFYTSTPKTPELHTETWTTGNQSTSPVLVSSIEPNLWASGDGGIGVRSVLLGGREITWDDAAQAFRIRGNVIVQGKITQLG